MGVIAEGAGDIEGASVALEESVGSATAEGAGEIEGACVSRSRRQESDA